MLQCMKCLPVNASLLVCRVYTGAQRVHRVAVGMGIPIGPIFGWELERFLSYGNFHMWESYGKSSFPHMGILWEFPQKSCGNGNENSLPTATLIISGSY